LWSATYDRELEDIFAIQDEIAGHIVQALKVALGAGEQEAIDRSQKSTENLEAYEHYLRGRYFWQRRGEENIRRAIDLFEQATELDPQFARAWSSLAAAHMTLPTYSDASSDVHDPLSLSAAQKALTLDKSLAEALSVLGDLARTEKEWAKARAYYVAAIANEPNNSTAHLWYAEHLVSVGRLRDAQVENLIAYELDPLHPGTNGNLAQVYMWLNEPENALKFGTAAWELGQASGLWVMTMTHLELGDTDRAIELAEQFEEQLGLPYMKMYVAARTDPAKLPAYLEYLAKLEQGIRFTAVFSSYGEFGLLDDAYRAIDQKIKYFRPNSTWAFWIPKMVQFRQDPRFAGVVSELGFLDYWREHGWPDVCQPDGESISCL
jgi:tetratricopeptide (TPR) repeat protein